MTSGRTLAILLACLAFAGCGGGTNEATIATPSVIDEEWGSGSQLPEVVLTRSQAAHLSPDVLAERLALNQERPIIAVSLERLPHEEPRPWLQRLTLFTEPLQVAANFCDVISYGYVFEPLQPPASAGGPETPVRLVRHDFEGRSAYVPARPGEKEPCARVDLANLYYPGIDEEAEVMQQLADAVHKARAGQPVGVPVECLDPVPGACRDPQAWLAAFRLEDLFITGAPAECHGRRCGLPRQCRGARPMTDKCAYAQLGTGPDQKGQPVVWMHVRGVYPAQVLRLILDRS
jgi:hypothetical protein